MEKDDLLNLFQIPNIVVKIPTVWFLENSMINKEILYNAHLMVRYRTIQAYYESQSWYKGTVSSQSEAEKSFNDYENYNKNFLSNYR